MFPFALAACGHATPTVASGSGDAPASETSVPTAASEDKVIDLGHWDEPAYNDVHPQTGTLSVHRTLTTTPGCGFGGDLPHGQWALTMSVTITSENDRGYQAFPTPIEISTQKNLEDTEVSNSAQVGWCNHPNPTYLEPGASFTEDGSVVLSDEQIKKGFLVMFSGSSKPRIALSLASIGVHKP
jgi:hypothetical protein